MSTSISLTVQNGAFSGTIPTFSFGDLYAVTLTFNTGAIAKDDVLLLALNDSRIFYSEGAANGDAPVMAAIRHDVTEGEARDHAVTLYMSARTRVFLERTNGLPKPLDCWLGLYVLRASDSSYATLAEARVKCNPVIADAVRSTAGLDTVHFYTKDEIDAIVASLNAQAADVEAAKVAAQAAQRAAETAQGKAEEAQTKAETAQGKAETAQGKAETAQGKAETAQGKAETAQGKAETAQTKAETAQDKAEVAATTAVNAMNAAASSAGAAASAANSAAGSANSAAQSASGAQSSATAAANAAQTAEEAKGVVNAVKTVVNTLATNASNAATNAASAANAAAGSAQNAQTSAENAETSATTASQQAQIATVKVGEAVQAAETVKNAAETVATAAEEAQQTLDEFEHRLSASYIYGMDWKDADLTQDKAGQCVVLNNLYDNAQYDTSLRYMQVEAHGVLPAHNWKRCTMRTARTVNYYLHQSNSRLKADGTAAVLTGADGDVMVEIDIVNFRIDTYKDSQDVTHYVWLCSDKPFNGSRPYPFFYVSPDGKTLRKQFVAAFRSCICDADGNTLNNNKTATTDTTYQADKTYYSRSNNVFTALNAGTDYTVGDTITQGSTVDTKIYQKTVVASPTGYANGRKYRSIVGALPAANATRAQFRNGHANNGFDSINFLFGSFMGMMMAIEYGTLSAQAKFSVGYSNLSSWDYKSMRLTGRTAIFGNNSGEIIADDADADGVDYDLLSMKSGATLWNATAQGNHAQRVVQCSYRGIEDPFGSQFTLDDGIQKNQDAYDVSITYDGNVYMRDDQDDPVSINLYCWKNASNVKFYTTDDEPSVGANLYKQVAMSEVQGTVASVAEDFSTITVGTAQYTRSSADDTDGHSYAWKYNESVIYSHVINPHTDANTRQVFSDAQLTVLLGNVSAVADDYSESGYWFTQSTAKYSYLDTNRGRLKGSEYVFPETGYTGEEAVWVHHEWPKASIYPCYFDRVTFLPLYRAGNWGATNKGLCDYLYNNANAGACVLARLGTPSSGSYAGPFYAYVYYGLTIAHAYYGSRLAA